MARTSGSISRIEVAYQKRVSELAEIRRCHHHAPRIEKLEIWAARRKSLDEISIGVEHVDCARPNHHGIYGSVADVQTAANVGDVEGHQAGWKGWIRESAGESGRSKRTVPDVNPIPSGIRSVEELNAGSQAEGDSGVCSGSRARRPQLGLSGRWRRRNIRIPPVNLAVQSGKDEARRSARGTRSDGKIASNPIKHLS